MTTVTAARPCTWRRSRLAMLGGALSLLATGVVTTVTTGTAHAASWVQVAGAAKDIGIGPQGQLWAVGSAGADNGKVFRANGSGGWDNMVFPGTALRITVDLSGNAWVVKSNNEISRWNGSSWITVQGTARDLGNGGGGQIWRAATNGTVFRWNYSTLNWDSMGGADVVRIDAEVGGVAWAVQSDGDIYRWNGGVSWILMSGQAQDIGVGSAGNQWATGESTTDAPVYERVSGVWTNRNGVGRSIDVDNAGRPWVVQSNGNIWVFA
jgi:hypothetical protein